MTGAGRPATPGTTDVRTDARGRDTARGCSHVPGTIAEPTASTCEECGSRINLRACATCGHVGCCESQLAHNTAHARASGHPVIYSMPRAGGFTWCYEDARYID